MFTRRWGWNIDRQDGNKQFPLSTTSLLSTQDKLAIWSNCAWHHATQLWREKANRMHVLCISSPFFLSHLKAFVFIQQTRVPTLCPAAPQAPGGLGVYLWGGSNFTVLFSYSSDVATNAGDPQFFLRFQGLKEFWIRGLSWWSSSWESAFQCSRGRFDPWLGN